MRNSTEDDYFELLFNEPCPNNIVCLLEVTVIIAVTFCSLFMNFAHLIVLLLSPSLRNSHGCLMISLSSADFLIGLVSSVAIYPSATRLANQQSWPYGDTVCLMTAFLTQVGITMSGITLTLLSLERYIAVAHALRYSRLVTKKITLICITITWIVPTLAYSTIFVGFPGHFYYPTLFVCLPMLFDNPFFALVLLVVSLSALFIILITSFIVRKKLATGFQEVALPTIHRTSEHLSLNKDQNIPNGPGNDNDFCHMLCSFFLCVYCYRTGACFRTTSCHFQFSLAATSQ